MLIIVNRIQFSYYSSYYILKIISNFAIAHKVYHRKFYSGKLCGGEIEYKKIRI